MEICHIGFFICIFYYCLSYFSILDFALSGHFLIFVIKYENLRHLPLKWVLRTLLAQNSYRGFDFAFSDVTLLYYFRKRRFIWSTFPNPIWTQFSDFWSFDVIKEGFGRTTFLFIFSISGQSYYFACKFFIS